MPQSSCCEDPGRSCIVHESNDVDGDEVHVVVDGGERADVAERVISRDAKDYCSKFRPKIFVYDLKDDCHEDGS